jgi:hypothetical protein
MSLKNINPNISKLLESPIMRNLGNMPKFGDAPKLIIAENPVHKTNKTIEELKEIIVEQGITADKQAKNTKWLTYLALFFAFVPIVTTILDTLKSEPKNQNLDISNKLLSLSNTNLENQVRILKLENELLKSKKTSEKEKKLP